MNPGYAALIEPKFLDKNCENHGGICFKTMKMDDPHATNIARVTAVFSKRYGYLNDFGHKEYYDAEVQGFIETCISIGNKRLLTAIHANVQMQKFTYTLDLSNMIQTNTTSNTVRAIQDYGVIVNPAIVQTLPYADFNGPAVLVTEVRLDSMCYCPINKDLFVYPVVCEDGRIYERDTIVAWLAHSTISPSTGDPMGKTMMAVYPMFYGIREAHVAYKKKLDKEAGDGNEDEDKDEDGDKEEDDSSDDEEEKEDDSSDDEEEEEDDSSDDEEEEEDDSSDDEEGEEEGADKVLSPSPCDHRFTQGFKQPFRMPKGLGIKKPLRLK